MMIHLLALISTVLRFVLCCVLCWWEVGLGYWRSERGGEGRWSEIPIPLPYNSAFPVVDMQALLSNHCIYVQRRDCECPGIMQHLFANGSGESVGCISLPLHLHNIPTPPSPIHFFFFSFQDLPLLKSCTFGRMSPQCLISFTHRSSVLLTSL